jgi:hypothetical protein
MGGVAWVTVSGTLTVTLRKSSMFSGVNVTDSEHNPTGNIDPMDAVPESVGQT